MPIRYYCRHCHVQMGEVDSHTVEAKSLGFHLLNEEERIDMIKYGMDGSIEVKSICEDCQEALERYPNYHSLQSFIQ